ncbi:MAG: T9SS type A sorting domain-containing protein [Candidatus Zhuqueibacterota bacterium]
MKLKLLLTGLILFAAAPGFSQRSLLHEQFSNPNFSTPAGIQNHVFNFFHHSCGGNLLGGGLASRLTNLGYTLHSHIDTQYEHENNYTDYRHWYKRFQRELGIKVGNSYYRYLGPDAAGEPTVGSQIDDNSDDFMLNYYEFNAERMDIIMFKPCYPGSDIYNDDTQYDGATTNNGYGNVTGGTPHSDNGANNFTYLNSGGSVEDGYSSTYWSGGDWWGSSSTLAQLKCAYRGMLNIFAEHPDILFIAMQAPPMVSISSEAAANCREFARWLREDWLHQFDPTGTDTFEDYPGVNVVPFDFHNTVAWTGSDSRLDGEYFWFPQGGFPDNTLDTSDPNKLGRNAGSEDHPESWLNQRTAAIFCGGTDSYSNSHTGKPARTYNAWINAVVNRWEAGATSVTAQQNAKLPADFSIAQNYPNPFNAGTSIHYMLLRHAYITLTVFSMTGQVVRNLLHEQQSPGQHSAYWNGLDDTGMPVSSGVYFYQLNMDNAASQFKKMTLLK